MAADPLDVLTVVEARDAIGRAESGADDATRLATFVTAISRWIDDNRGPMVARTVTNETHDGGDFLVQLKCAPVSSVSTLTVYDNTTAYVLTAETNTTKTTTNFSLNPKNGIVWRRTGNCDRRWEAGRRNVVVTYTAGRFASTATVDQDVKEAAKVMLRHLFSVEHGSGGELFSEGLPPGFAVPNRALELLSAYPKREPLVA